MLERAASGDLTLSFGDIASFGICFAERRVTLIAAHPQADQATIDHLIDDHVAPRLIAADGTLVLHSAAVIIDGRLAIFLGETGSGKSTLAASLHAQGHQLLGDDAVIITETSGGLVGEPVYPSLRLYPESIAQVFAAPVETANMAFYSDKMHVAAFGAAAGAVSGIPLGAIFILTEGETDVSLRDVWPSDACMTLVENSFSFDPHDPVAATKRMAQAARVAAALPFLELSYPYDFDLLGEVRAAVIASLSHSADAA